MHRSQQYEMENLCLHQCFETRAEKTPDAVAITFEHQQLSYKELDIRANQLAHRLRRRGIGPDVLVALFLERSLDMLIGILGILKAGGAYLPLDLSYPKDRIAFMLKDGNVSIVLSQQSLLPKLPVQENSVICVDDGFSDEPETRPEIETTPENLAYCIYTSGSTGKPKGVLVTHHNVVRLFTTTDQWFRFGPTDVWTLFHSYAFDLSVWEIWGALLYGGRLIIVPYLVSRSPDTYWNLIETEAVTALTMTPSAFQQLLWAEASADKSIKLSLRYIVLAGEKLEMQSLRPWFDRHGGEQTKLINMYGITETTVHVTYREIKATDIDGPSVIGSPIPDLEIVLLDGKGQTVADGQPGEICVSGPGVARGYLNREDLTALRFVTRNATRLYRSGDLARRLPDGDLEYMGRIDKQVKIRGHRIELGEIETILHKHPVVRSAVVEARNNRLVAYVVSQGIQPTISDLRNFTNTHLPEYMIPSAFMFLEALPLTTNGKVNRRALPDPGHERPQLSQDYQPPQTATETILAEIWEQILGIYPIGVADNFFELGGDSIRMIQVIAQARERSLTLLPAQLFNTPTIRGLATNECKQEALASENFSVKPFALLSQNDRDRIPDEVEAAYPLVALQAGMHYHKELTPISGIFHDIFSFEIGYLFDAAKLKESIQRLAGRHEMLRTSFDWTTCSVPIQRVHQNVSVPFGVEDLSSLTPAEQHEALISWIEVEKQREFDYQRAPLIRFHVQKIDNETFQFFVSFHHAVLDGWSLASMVSELFHDYVSAVRNNPVTIKPPRTHYRDYVAQEQTVVVSEHCRNFWREHLQDAARQSLPRWPKSFLQDGIEQKRGPEVEIDSSLFTRLRKLAILVGVPLRTVLLAAHFRVLQRLNGEDDVISGVVMNGRPEQRDGERMLGLFLNVAPLRMNLANGSWIDLIHRIYKTENRLMPYRRFPLSEIQQQMGGRAPFEAAFNFVQWHVYRPLQEQLGMTFKEGPYYEVNNFTLLITFFLDFSGTALTFHFDYDPKQLAEKQVESFGNYYLAALKDMAMQPNGLYNNFCPLSSKEKQKVFCDWNKTKTDYPRNSCIHELFEAQAGMTPDAVAVILGEEQLTYRELNEQADRLAGHLYTKGVEPGSLVGLCTNRSLEMIVALLGILKAGGVYVPLDPSYPPERLQWMITDSGMKVLLIQNHLLEQLPVQHLEVIRLDTYQAKEPLVEVPPRPVSADMLVYVMYTSGSTGIPKGVAIPHRAVVRLLFGIDYVHLGSDQTFLHLSPISFDASTFEIWGALLHGARCVLYPEKVITPQQMSEVVERYRVTTLWMTAALYNAVIDDVPHSLKSVEQLLIGGEPLSVDHVRRGLKTMRDTQFINGYGPTESTTFACCYRIPKSLDDNLSSIPIGRPISNTRTYILDSRLKPLPTGVAGELYIGGDGLAQGYWNRPELTDERFIPNPFEHSSKARLYRTGDLVRHLPGGNIEFIGRRDHQVKIRGFRIELGEIEAALHQHTAVKEAVVLAREDQPGKKTLVGYVVSASESAPSLNDLWLFLRDKLPGYMVPPTFVFLPELPLNANGKVNRQALPAPDQERPELEPAYVAPRNATEQTVASIWSFVLDVEQVGVDDNFFELGGESLVAIRIISRVRKATKKNIPLKILFDHPTVAEMAEFIDSSE